MCRFRAIGLVVALTVVAAGGCGRSEPARKPGPHPSPTAVPVVEEPRPEPAASGRARERRRISGEVFYRDRVRLPSDAVLTARLLAHDGSGSEVVAESTATPRRQVPIPFEVEYWSTDIEDGVHYRLDVLISRRGEEVFVLAEPVPVITDGAPSQGLRLLLRRKITAPVAD